MHFCLVRVWFLNVMEEKTTQLKILLIFFSHSCVKGFNVGFFTHSGKVRVNGKSAK